MPSLAADEYTVDKRPRSSMAYLWVAIIFLGCLAFAHLIPKIGRSASYELGFQLGAALAAFIPSGIFATIVWGACSFKKSSVGVFLKTWTLAAIAWLILSLIGAST